MLKDLYFIDSSGKDWLKLFLERTGEQTEKVGDVLFSAEEILAEVRYLFINLCDEIPFITKITSHNNEIIQNLMHIIMVCIRIVLVIIGYWHR